MNLRLNEFYHFDYFEIVFDTNLENSSYFKLKKG